MANVLPFKGLTPKPSVAQQVVAPPYDVVTREQVKARTHNNPLNFLHITRAEGDCADNVAFNDLEVYETARQNWQTFLSDKIFEPADAQQFYIYGMTQNGQQQLGLMALTSVKDYKNGLVRKHELTRVDKENDRVQHIQALNGQVSPVMLAVRDEGEIAALLSQCAQGAPLVEGTVNDVHHAIWPVDDSVKIAAIEKIFADEHLLYVADGHHRTAAALRAYEESPDDSAPGSNPYCFSVIFPSQDMKILGYHRVVNDLNGLTPDTLLKALEQHYKIIPLSNLDLPQQKGDCHLYIAGKSYCLTRKAIKTDDPIAALDAAALSTYVLEPLLGIKDIRTDARISFVGGLNALDEIKQQVDSGDAKAGFILYPTQMDELLAVADANQLMPPKSTWFEPKLADGLVCYAY